MSLLVEVKKELKGFHLEVNFNTEEGRMGVLGASGCGKSMTLKCIAGIITPDEGKIILNNKVLYDSDKKINLIPQKRKVGYLFQNYALFPNMTVEENIGCGIKGNKRQKKEVVDKMMELLRITEYRNRYPGQLSGGQQQRVALGRILAYEPDILMLDEPFSALDYYLKDKLQQELLEVLELYKGHIIMVSHSRDEIYRFCENMMVMDQGKVEVKGATKNIFESPEKVVAAKLTGCKNISKIKKLTDDTFLACDWGVQLIGEGKISDEITHVGIRAHDLMLGKSLDDENTFLCKSVGISEGPFENQFVLQLNGEENLIWKINKSHIDSGFEEGANLITLPKEALMYLHM